MTPSDVLVELGSRVRATRAHRGWTRDDLARRAGVSVRYLAELEGGAGNISVLRLAEVAAALDVSFAALLGGLGPVHDDADRAAALDPRARATLLERSEAPTRIALVGLRGAGKSTVGARVAELLGCPFVELDARVEALAGMRLGDIFEFHGAARYREIERQALDDVFAGQGPVVVATGGSLVTDAETWAHLRSRARTVWLRASPDAHLARVEAQGDFRPMRGREDAREELEGILAARTPLYAQADIHVDTEAGSPESIARVLAGRAGRPAFRESAPGASAPASPRLPPG